MTWPFRRKGSSVPSSPVLSDADREAQLRHAELEAEQLRVRAERVGEKLAARLRRNHWSEAIQRTARHDA